MALFADLTTENKRRVLESLLPLLKERIDTKTSRTREQDVTGQSTLLEAGQHYEKALERLAHSDFEVAAFLYLYADGCLSAKS